MAASQEREKRARERGREGGRERVIVRVLHRWRLYQRRRNRCSGTGEIGARAWGKNVCECETEVMRVLPDLSTSREGRRGSGRGVAAGGLAIHGRQALREMGEEKRKENWGREWAR
jgi:hypothetical protein